MRRKDREITDKNEIFDIMKRCDCCSVALFDKEYPYVIPMNFGAELTDKGFALYFHSAADGTKLRLIKQNNHAAFEMSCSHRLVTGEKACMCTMEYESVCGKGSISILPKEDKIRALTAIMDQYQHMSNYEFDKNAVDAVCVLKLTVDEISGKRLIIGR